MLILVGVELPLRVVVTILECCVTFSGVKLSTRSFVLFITSSNTHIDMSEDVPIYLDRGQKSSSDSHDEKAEKKCKFFTEEENEALRRGLQRYGQGKWTRILKDSEFSALQG